jgi:hypothetical protein
MWLRYIDPNCRINITNHEENSQQSFLSIFYSPKSPFAMTWIFTGILDQEHTVASQNPSSSSFRFMLRLEKGHASYIFSTAQTW